MNWISVDEKLPKPYVSVLVYMPGEAPFPMVHEGVYMPNNTWHDYFYEREFDEVTHWAEMPEPPKEGE